MDILARKSFQKMGLPPGTLVYVGEQKPDPLRLTLVHYNENKQTVEIFESWDRAQAAIALVKGHIWLHVEGFSDIRCIEQIGRQFGLHNMSLEDSLNTHHRPKMSEFTDYLHFILKLVYVGSNSVDIRYEHCNIFVGPTFVISVQEQRKDFFAKIRERVISGDAKLCKFGSAYLAFVLLDFAIDHYYLALNYMEEAVDRIETKVLKNPNDLLLDQLYDIRSETALIRKMVFPVREFIRNLLKEPPAFIDENIQIYYRDLEDHAIQIVDGCNSIKETLANILEISDSYSSHRMNMIIKFLTMVSVIFLPLNFLAGLYGMNLHLPIADTPNSFFVITGMMTVIALILALYFKMKRWW